MFKQQKPGDSLSESLHSGASPRAPVPIAHAGVNDHCGDVIEEGGMLQELISEKTSTVGIVDASAELIAHAGDINSTEAVIEESGGAVSFAIDEDESTLHFDEVQQRQQWSQWTARVSFDKVQRALVEMGCEPHVDELMVLDRWRKKFEMLEFASSFWDHERLSKIDLLWDRWAGWATLEEETDEDEEGDEYDDDEYGDLLEYLENGDFK
jgi:hypothetical protein